MGPPHHWTGNQYGYAVAVGADNNLYTAGEFTGTIEFNPGGPSMPRSSAGAVDVYIARYSLGGNPVWGTSVGGPGTDKAFGIGADANLSVYSAGVFADAADFDPGPGQVVVGPPGGHFVSKLVVPPPTVAGVRVNDGGAQRSRCGR